MGNKSVQLPALFKQLSVFYGLFGIYTIDFIW